MAIHYFDTSALGKHYHPEIGTPKVDFLLSTPGIERAIFRLTVVEMHSVFAKKLRMGAISETVFQNLSIRFRYDFKTRKYTVVRLLLAHFQIAESLIQRIGPTQNLRTLDALQLAAAIRMNSPSNPVLFISADRTLCSIAAGEGLSIVNPELS